MKTIEERFWSKVNKDGPIPEHMPHLGKCWVWIGGTNGQKIQRGTITIGGVTQRAYRVSMEIHKIDIPKGMDVCHKCDNGLCVNPSHLKIGTRSENILDAASKGRLRNQNKDKTHCLNGHALSGLNLCINKQKNGRQYRDCKACRKERARIRWINGKLLTSIGEPISGAEPAKPCTATK